MSSYFFTYISPEGLMLSTAIVIAVVVRVYEMIEHWRQRRKN
jgi:hypothetical protein